MPATPSRLDPAVHQVPKIVFLHIPKTAGMSLHGLFIRNYRGMGIFNVGVKDITEEEWQGCLQRIRNISPDELDKYVVFKGHMIFGLHELLPGPVEYITFLRDPVKRIVSHYKMVRGLRGFSPGHMIDPSKNLWNLGEYPAFCRSLDNYQTRALAGIDFELPFGACTEKHLRMAVDNMDRHFKFVGLTEQFDLSLMLMRHVCGWGWRYYISDNVGSDSSVDVPAKVLEALRELNRFDFELYRHAREKFDRMVEHYGWRLRAECQAYRLGNQIHLRLHQGRHKIKQQLGIEGRRVMGSGGN